MERFFCFVFKTTSIIWFAEVIGELNNVLKVLYLVHAVCGLAIFVLFCFYQILFFWTSLVLFRVVSFDLKYKGVYCFKNNADKLFQY